VPPLLLAAVLSPLPQSMNVPVALLEYLYDVPEPVQPAGSGAASARMVELSERRRATLASTLTVVVILAAACTHVHASRTVIDARETVLYRRETLWLPVPDGVSGFTAQALARPRPCCSWRRTETPPARC
jgi:hypothetical protein